MDDEHAINIKEALGILQIKHEGSTYRGHPDKTVLNWGSSRPKCAEVYRSKIINHPDAIYRAVNKILTFNALKNAGVSHVPFTNDPDVAHTWLKLGKTICARHKVEGKDGAGLEIIKPLENLPYVKLYTEFIPAQTEYRIMVFNGKVTSRQVKVKCRDRKSWNEDIRTTDGGWGFDPVADVPKEIDRQSINSVEALGLVFGGIDIILGKDGKAYVLEVNTAPDLTPFALRAFVAAVKEYVK